MLKQSRNTLSLFSLDQIPDTENGGGNTCEAGIAQSVDAVVVETVVSHVFNEALPGRGRENGHALNVIK